MSLVNQKSNQVNNIQLSEVKNVRAGHSSVKLTNRKNYQYFRLLSLLISETGYWIT